MKNPNTPCTISDIHTHSIRSVLLLLLPYSSSTCCALHLTLNNPCDDDDDDGRIRNQVVPGSMTGDARHHEHYLNTTMSLWHAVVTITELGPDFILLGPKFTVNRRRERAPRFLHSQSIAQLRRKHCIRETTCESVAVDKREITRRNAVNPYSIHIIAARMCLLLL